MEEIRTVPNNPGSLHEYELSHPDLSCEEAQAEHSKLIDIYAGELAAYHGIDREDLHAMNFPRDGELKAA